MSTKHVQTFNLGDKVRIIGHPTDLPYFQPEHPVQSIGEVVGWWSGGRICVQFHGETYDYPPTSLVKLAPDDVTVQQDERHALVRAKQIAKGDAKYGRPLTTDTLINPFDYAEEELYDLEAYLTKARLQYERLREENHRLRVRILELEQVGVEAAQALVQQLVDYDTLTWKDYSRKYGWGIVGTVEGDFQEFIAQAHKITEEV